MSTTALAVSAGVRRLDCFLVVDGRCVLAGAIETRDSLTIRLVQEGFWRLHTMVVNCLSLVWNREDVQQVEMLHGGLSMRACARL